MLLRRVAQHVRQQNWLAVGIDFFIVVIGVYIGLQVNNWDATQAERRMERVLLAQLETDFRDLDERLTLEIERLLNQSLELASLIELVRAQNVPDDDPAVKRGIRAAVAPPDPPPPPISFTEALSSGGFSIIQDAALRRALTKYGQAVDSYANYTPVAVRAASDYNSQIYRAFYFETDRAEMLASGEFVLSYDVKELEQAGPELQVMMAWALNGERAASRQQGLVREVLALIGENQPSSSAD
jgi:hypothetical protein